MDPVEINAGSWYLRGLRDDDRVTDRPALSEIGVTDPGYVAESVARWSDDSRCTWAVCEPTTGELWALVTADLSDDGTATVTGTPRSGSSALTDALPAVHRFLTDGLDRHVKTP